MHLKSKAGRTTTSSTLSMTGKSPMIRHARWPFTSDLELIACTRYALNGSPYTIHFFLGDAPAGAASTYARADNHIGCVYTFSSRLEHEAPESAGCQNCAAQKKKGVLSTAQVPITSPLLSTAKNPQIPQLQSLEPEGVESYLTANLHWRAVEVRCRSLVRL